MWSIVLCSCHTGPSEVAPGVVNHAIYATEGPWVIQLLEIDSHRAWQAGVRLRTARAGVAASYRALTSELAKSAIAGVNGDFFRPAGDVVGLHIETGEIVRGPRPRTALAITDDGTPIIDVFRLNTSLITRAGGVLHIAGFNTIAVADAATMYNHHGRVRSDSVHAAVGLLLRPLRSPVGVNDTLSTRVIQVRRQGWPLRLDRGQFLVAIGDSYPLAVDIAAGDTVHLFRGLAPAVGRVMEAISGGPRLIRNGVVTVEYEREHLDKEFAETRHPRTAVGYSRNGSTVFLLTVDGRQPGFSVGMTLSELAEFMSCRLATYTVARRNAFQAVNLDGGGSTTMVIRGEVVNRPSDPTGEQQVASALLVMDDSEG